MPWRRLSQRSHYRLHEQAATFSFHRYLWETIMRNLILGLMLATATMTTAAMVSAAPAAATADVRKAPVPVHYRTANIEGLDIFYREAGPADAPVVLLLHGFPTSSHMFRNLIPLLADRYHVIAPDYPGYGQSAAPDHGKYAYTFAATANIVDKFLDQLAVKSYAMYVMDYGAPVGYRLALKHPERVIGLIIQNGNAYDEGLKEFWDPIKTYWSDGSAKSREALNGLVTLETTKFQYTDGMEDVSRISPDNWVHDQALLDRPGNRDIQLDMLYDYRTNVPLYPDFQSFFRERKPPTLIIWGKNDYIFPEAGAHPYLKDLPNAEVHILNSGHFLLEEKLDVAAPLINDFLDRNIAGK
jgi:pimeloyl-ACP methyl ester carboxylesterase